MERIRTRGADGRIVVVIRHRSQIDTSDLDGSSCIEGATRHFLGDGSTVNVKGDGFEVVATGERLRRI